MNWWILLGFTLPSLIMAGCVWIVLHKMYKNEDNKRMWELKKQTQKEISSVRLRAYERLTLLLERTQPEHLLMDMDLSNMTMAQLQQHLLRTIRLEFDHNMSQQIYVSEELWDKIIQSRDEMGAFITAMAVQMPKESTTLDYAKVLMTAYRNNGVTPHQIAMQDLKAEARTLFN